MAILEFLTSMIDNCGAAIIVPVIIGIIALFFRVKPQKAFLSALYAGVSLEGISLMVGDFTRIITPLVKNLADAMVNITGVNLNVFDVGWQATSLVAFSTSAGMIYLGLGIVLQTVLFLIKWTKCFQPSDLWNNYSYMVWGAMVIFATDNFALGIACMVLPQSLLARYRRDFATYANTVSRFEQQTLCEFMAGGYFTRHLARMRLAYKRRMEAFAAALRAALPGAELDGVHSGLHFLLTLPGAGDERAMVEAAARQGVRLRGLSEYYLARPELCRPDTVVAGYSALREEDVEAVAAALARAWLKD